MSNTHKDVKPEEKHIDQESGTSTNVTDSSATPMHNGHTSTTGSNEFEEDVLEQFTVTSNIENEQRNEEENGLQQQHTQQESNKNADESVTGQALIAPSQPYLRGRIFLSYIRILQNNLKIRIKLIKENEDEDLRKTLERLLEQLNNQQNSMTYTDFVNIRATIRSYCELVNIFADFEFLKKKYVRSILY